ncbi:Peptidase-S15 domain-containing protein [Mycena sanguinolenta]|uniref:Peptidase-S15 domain-containing protein n=1 Tax=Mycena sanguinolenta TaxID=230812 RepID=A0A8H7DLI0_9AGAR|nr:Peptidase-S15 domain-containing protein [Mycena sanguinolenta]
MTQTSISIPSLTPGWNLDAWEYSPTKTRGPHPVVVMAHGLGCNKLLGLAAFAEEFCAAGYACIVFDYRRWGGVRRSDGTRRNSVYVSEQQDDYRTVIKYARQQPQYDPHRVVIWGFSFSGGHVLTLASDPVLNVAASMAHNPYCGRPFPPFQFNRRYITLFAFGLLDLLADFLNLSPVYIPVVGSPGVPASIGAPGASEGFSSVAKDPSDFPNQIAASIFYRAPLHHRPRDSLHLIRRPILLTAAKGDRICPPTPVVETSRIVPTAELVQVSGDHFDIFKGNADWEKAIEAQLAFLRQYVPV